MNDYEKVLEIHKASINILEEIGIEIQDEESLELVKKNGIKVDGNRAYFTEVDINKYIQMAPTKFNLRKINVSAGCEYAIIGGNEINLIPCSSATKIRESNGDIRNATLEDYMKMLKIADASGEFSIMCGGLVVPPDISVDIWGAISTYILIKKSRGGIFLSSANQSMIKQGFDLLSIYFGGKDKFKEEYNSISLVNTLTPLKIDDVSISTIKSFCEYNQPIGVTTAPMSGGTAPVNITGTIALGNAEVLAYIALIQMIKPGHPVFYGSASMTTDMASAMASIGSPQVALQGKYYSKLADYYKLPKRITGALSDANGATAQAGYESMMNLNIAFEEHTNFIFHAAGITDGFGASSFDKFILDLEIISMLREYYKDIDITDKAFSIDVIKDVISNNGSFLTHKNTAKNCRKLSWTPTISQRGKVTLGDTPNNLMQKSIDDRIEYLLNKYEEPKLDKEIENKLDEYMRSIGVSQQLLDRINNM